MISSFPFVRPACGVCASSNIDGKWWGEEQARGEDVLVGMDRWTSTAGHLFHAVSFSLRSRLICIRWLEA